MPATHSIPTSHRWTSDEYYRMGKAGLFYDQRVELVNGQILDIPTLTPQVAIAMTLVRNALDAIFDPHHTTVFSRSPLNLGNHSQPDPDLSVIAGNIREFREHPTTALLVVETADVSVDFDRDVKSPLYATAGIPEYWLIDLPKSRLEVRRNPQSIPTPHYAELLILSSTDSISPLAAPHATIAISSLLP